MQRNSDRASRSLFAFAAWVTVGSLVVALLVRALVAQVYLVPSGSMEPTLQVGDHVLVEKLTRWWRQIHRGDVIVFDGTDVWGSATDGLLVAKRVIGLPGDHVVCCDVGHHVVRNGVVLREPWIIGRTRGFDVVVPAGRLWVLGDDRASSQDSSAFQESPGGGTVPTSHVLGRVLAVVWPLSHAGILGPPRDGGPR